MTVIIIHIITITIIVIIIAIMDTSTSILASCSVIAEKFSGLTFLISM